MKNTFKEYTTKIEHKIAKQIHSSASFGSIPQTILNKYIEKLVQPCTNLIEQGGKRWRPLFLVLTGQMIIEKNATAYSPEMEKKAIARLYTLSPLIEYIHTASLIHDDIEDKAQMRRGKPCAHLKYGLDTALNSASWLYFQATACLEAAYNQDEYEKKALVYKEVMLELRRLHLGQAMDITWHNNNTVIPSIDEYLQMTELKTGTLASLAAKIGALGGGENLKIAQSIAKKAAQIGVGFQIADDIINLTKGNVGKKRGDDIVEGKKSLPVLLFLQEHPEHFETLMFYFEKAKQHGIDSEYVEKAIILLHKSNALEIAKKKSIELINNSCNAIIKNYATTAQAQNIKTLFQTLYPY